MSDRIIDDDQEQEKSELTENAGSLPEGTAEESAEAETEGSTEAETEDSGIADEAEEEEAAPVKASGKTTAALVSIILVLVAVIVIFIVVALTRGKDDSAESDSNTVSDSYVSVSDSSTEDADEEVVYDVTTELGQYIGIEVDYDDVTVTEEEIEDELKSLQEDLTTVEEITDRAVADGDTVNIDFTGYMDGEEFSGGSSTDYDLTIGSGSFISGFESGLIGAMPGDEVTLDLNFPDPYTVNEELSGEPVTFVVKVNYIAEDVVPELTDAFIAANTDYSTLAGYIDYIEKYLQEEKIAEADEQAEDDIFEIIVSSSTFGGDIDAEIADYAQQYMDYWDQMANAYYGIDGATLFSYMYGISEDDYKELLTAEAEYSIKYQHVLDQIAEAENLSVTDEEFEAEFEDVFYDYYGFETKEEVLEQISEEEANEMITKSVLREKAKQLVIDSAVINK